MVWMESIGNRMPSRTVTAGTQIRDDNDLDQLADGGRGRGAYPRGTENTMWSKIGSSSLAGEGTFQVRAHRFLGCAARWLGVRPTGTRGHWARTGWAWKMARGGLGPKRCFTSLKVMNISAIRLTSQSSSPSLAT